MATSHFLHNAHDEHVLIDSKIGFSKDWSKLKNGVQDYFLCPMAANIQYAVYRGKSGTLYLRCDLNEHIISIKNDDRQYIKLDEAIAYFRSLAK